MTMTTGNMRNFMYVPQKHPGQLTAAWGFFLYYNGLPCVK